MRHTAEAVPPRCPGHHKLAHERTDRYASQRSGWRTGQGSHAQKDAAQLDCPRLALSCQATFRPPVGAATRSNRRCALPPLAAPQGAAQGRHRHRCALPVPLVLPAPRPPHGGSADRLRSCMEKAVPLLPVPTVALSRRPGLPLNTVSACHGEMGRSVCTYLQAVFPPSSEDFALYCRRAPASRPGLAARTSRTAPAV
jgi:hypothetical protein